MKRALIFSEFYLKSFLKSRLFFGLVAFVLITISILCFLSYQTLNYANYDSFSYIISRIQGLEKTDLLYFLWTIPYSILVVFIPAVLASFVFAHDIESGEARIYYSYPVSRISILSGKLLAAFLLSFIPLSLYETGETLFLSAYLGNYPPITFAVSYLLSMLGSLSVICLVSLSSSIVKNSVFSIFFFLLVYFVIFNIINFYSVIIGGSLPYFLLNNDVNSVTQVFSQINLIPFGNAGQIQGASFLEIARDASIMCLYSCFSLLFSMILMSKGDIS